MGTNHKSFESSSRLTVKGGSSKHTDLIVKTIMFGKATSLLNRSWNNLLPFEYDENINNKIFTTVWLRRIRHFLSVPSIQKTILSSLEEAGIRLSPFTNCSLRYQKIVLFHKLIVTVNIRENGVQLISRTCTRQEQPANVQNKNSLRVGKHQSIS